MLLRSFALALSLTLMGCASTSALLGGVPQGYEDNAYKIAEAGGINAQISPKDASQSTYRQGFIVNIKNAQAVASIKIERVNKDGSRTLIIDDSANPTRASDWQAQQPNGAQSRLDRDGNTTQWIGQSPALPMDKTHAPWLYDNKTTHERFYIQITDLQGKVTAFEQQTRIPKEAKETYLFFLQSER